MSRGRPETPPSYIVNMDDIVDKIYADAKASVAELPWTRLDIDVEVAVPFDFCSKCGRLKLNEYHAYLWANGEPIAYEYSCEHSYFCKAIIDLYKSSMEEKDG